MKPCRECGHQIAHRAKTCPNCGVKKPAASKAEAGLDAFAGFTAKLGCLIIILVVVVFIAVGVIAVAV